MNQRSLAVLILLNVVLLAGVVVTALAPEPAQAQFAGRNQYTMISGNVAGRGQQAAVYIINLNTSQMVGLLFNTLNDELEVIDGRVIGNDLAGAGTGRR